MAPLELESPPLPVCLSTKWKLLKHLDDHAIRFDVSQLPTSMLLNSKVSNYAGFVSKGMLTFVVVRVTGAGALQLIRVE